MEVPRSFNELLSDKQANFGSLGDELRGIELGNNCLQHLGGGRGGEGRRGERKGTQQVLHTNRSTHGCELDLVQHKSYGV